MYVQKPYVTLELQSTERPKHKQKAPLGTRKRLLEPFPAPYFFQDPVTVLL